jgi:tetratricopeptide (TPR) repeat protein
VGLNISLLLLLIVSPLALAQGQYRSRIMIDPLGELGKSSEMSVEELEGQIASISDPYARSSATRHLARHYVQQQDYASAIDYYRQALAAGGLADVANREMLRELAQVYLLDENYREAAATLERALRIELVPAAPDFLLLAQARYKVQDYVGVVEALDGIAANGLTLDVTQMRQALALYYRAGAYEQCAELLQQLLQLQPLEASHWHQLASVYLKQDKRRQALDQLVLAMEKGIPFNQQELMLLVDLQAVNGNPYGAAQLLEQAMDAGRLPVNVANQRKAFELWFQARERQRAARALEKAAYSSGDTELYLYLAQLQMEDQQWQAVQQTILKSCEQRLQDRYVSRANLYLGVGLLKQGRAAAARQSFINATLVGGANDQAAQWLQFMEAAPPDEDELRRVRGPCYGSEGRKAALAAEPAESSAEELADQVDQSTGPELALVAETVEIKTVPATRFYYSSHPESMQELLPEMRSLAVRLNVTLVKAGASADGPLHLIARPDEDLRLAFPVRGSPQARGRYRMEKSESFTCAWAVIEGEGAEALAAALEFASQVQAAGHTLSGERRLIPRGGGDSGFEIQLGIE